MGRKPIREQRRREILDALYRCLLRKAYRETSIKDIGAEAGINYAMLHYYFKSKQDILLCFIDRVYEHYQALFDREVHKLQEEGLTPQEILRKAFHFVNTRITTDKRLQIVFVEIWEIAMYNPAVNARMKKIYTEWIRRIASIMQGQSRDERKIRWLAMSLVAFHEGIGLFSVLFDLRKKDTLAMLESFQEKLLETLPGHKISRLTN
jgi:AcrR family transcriptional regulator